MTRHDVPRTWASITARVALALMAAPAACCLFLAVLTVSPSSPEAPRWSPEGARSAVDAAGSKGAPSRLLRSPEARREPNSESSRSVEPASYLRNVDESSRPIALLRGNELQTTLDDEAVPQWLHDYPEARDFDSQGARPISQFVDDEDRPYAIAGSMGQLAAGDPPNPLRHVGDEAPADAAAGPDATVRIPLATSVPPGAVQVNPQNGLVTIAIREAPLDQILGILAEREGLNLICAEDVTANISITVNDAPFDEALAHILSVAGCTCRRQGNFLLITSVAAGGTVSPEAQGREIRVFSLSYVSAADVDLVIKGLLSPVGQSFMGESDPQDHRKTREVLIVEDLPPYLARIEQTVEQLDTTPRQVLIEAHVLSVELEDDLRHGVDWAYLKKNNPVLTLETTGFANAAAPQAMIFDLAATELTSVVEWLKTTTDAKTLASPKVFALNGQEARIQIGEQLGYRVTTTTQTSTMESIDFLEVGVILTVTPQITPDNHVLMKVKPVVSSGQISPDTELPEEETTEVETSVMLRDGHGIVIGGLIQEEDIETQQKIPWLGDMWLVGWLFQKRNVDRKRSEIIIALIPHVVPYGPEISQRETQQFHQATTPLVQGALEKYPRPWEATLPSAHHRPAWLLGRRRSLFGSADVTYDDPDPETAYYSEVPATPPPYYDTTPFQEGVQDGGDAATEMILPPSP